MAMSELGHDGGEGGGSQGGGSREKRQRETGGGGGTKRESREHMAYTAGLDRTEQLWEGKRISWRHLGWRAG